MQIVQQQPEILREAVQRRHQAGRADQAQAQELECAAAQRARKHSGRFVIALLCQQAIQPGKLLVGHARPCLLQQGRRNARVQHAGRLQVRVQRCALQQIVHEIDGNGGKGAWRLADYANFSAREATAMQTPRA